MKSFLPPSRARLVRPCFHLPSSFNVRVENAKIRSGHKKRIVVRYDATEIQRADWEISGGETPINILRDFGPSGLHLLGTSSWRPDYKDGVKNGLPVVRFDKSSSLYRPGVPLWSLGSRVVGSCTAVLRARQFTGNAPLINCDFGSLTERVRYVFGSGSGSDQVWLGNGTAGTFTIARTDLASWAVVTLQRAETEYENYVNGVLNSSNRATGTAPPAATAGSGTLLMGYVLTGNPSGAGFEGDLGEIIVHAEPLTPGEIRDLHQHLMEKWGVGRAGRGRKVYAPGVVSAWDACDIAQAHGSNVTNWPAYVGGASHTLDTVKATGPTFTDNNKDGMPGVSFSGGGIYTSATIDPLASSPDMSLYIVWTPGTQTVTFAPLIIHGANTAPFANWLLTCRNGTTNVHYFAAADAPSGTYRTFTSGPAWREGRQLVHVVKSGVNGTITNDVDQSGSTASLHAGMTTNSKAMHVGVKDQNNEAFVGQIHEIILCNQAHSASQVLEVKRQLANKWNLSPY